MKFGKSKVFLSLCVAFVTGVLLGRYFDAITAGVMLAVFILLVTVWWSDRRVVFAGFLGILMIVGVWRYQSAQIDQNSSDFIGQYFDQEITFEGVVADDPDVRENKTNVVVNPLSISPYPAGGRQGEKVEGKVLLNVGRYPEYKYGDRLKIVGKLEEPFESEEFSYKNYLARYGVYGLIRFPEIEKLGEGHGNIIKNALLAVKHKFKDTLSQILPEPHNAFILGLILGLKRAIPEDLKQAFIVTGVSHIVVISGYNISIITRNILHTRVVFGRRFAFWLSLGAVLAFVIMTGGEASVIRASVMGMLLVFALNIGRMYQIINALVLTGAVMVALNPKILVFDIGFQLSFLATLGLVYLAPMFDKWFEKVPNFLEFRTNLSSTLAAQIFTLPLLIYYFDRISLIAPLTNVLILWAIPYAMFFGFFAGLLGMVFLPAGQFLAGILWVILEYMIWVVEFFARFDLASVNASISIPIIIIFYLILAWLVWSYRKYKNFRWHLEYIRYKL